MNVSVNDPRKRCRGASQPCEVVILGKHDGHHTFSAEKYDGNDMYGLCSGAVINAQRIVGVTP
jgi:hypothetical protein